MKKLAKSKLKKFNKLSSTDKKLIFVLDNIAYARNVASIFNLAYALKIEQIYLSGMTPTPPFGKDLQKVSRQTETRIKWTKAKDITKLLSKIKSEGVEIIAVAVTENSIKFQELINKTHSRKIAIIVGNEKQGLANHLLTEADKVVNVPVYRPLAHLNVVTELAVIGYSLI